MANTKAAAGLRDEVLALAAASNIKDLEAKWTELCENPPQQGDFYVEFAKVLTKAKARPVALNLIGLLLTDRQKRKDWKFIPKIVAAVATLWPDATELRAPLIAAFRGQYGDSPHFDEILAESKLEQEDEITVENGFKRFRTLWRLTPGQVYQHSTWGEGVVKTLDLQGRKLELDFIKEKGKTVSFEGVGGFLKYIAPSHFLAKRTKELDKLTAQAEATPASVIRLILESYGGSIKQGELKTLLLDKVIASSAWNSWWSRARNDLRLDPLIDFDSKGGLHTEIRLRATPKSLEEEIADIFFSEGADLQLQVEAFQRLSKEQKNFTPAPALIARMLKKVDENYRIAQPVSPALALEYAFLREDIAKLGEPSAAGAIPTVKAALAGLTDYTTLAEIENVEYAMRALKILFERDGNEGIEKAIEMLPHAPVKLAQAIWKEMDREHHIDLAVRSMEKLFSRPLENHETYLWAVKAILEGGWGHMDDYFPISWVVPEIFESMDDWNDAAESAKENKLSTTAAKSLLTKTRTLLQADHYAVVCRAAEAMSLEQAQRFRRTIQLVTSLPEPFRLAVDRALTLTRKDLIDKGAITAMAEPEFHYCTGRLRAEKLKELAHLNSFEIPGNSKEIEEARQEGDLRENAGYHAAKDKQKMLMQKSLQLQQAITSARIFATEHVRTDSIGFGTAFSADNLKLGKQESFIVLGRWEADAAKGILSYQAPLMQQFLDKKVGDEVMIKHPGGGETPYRVVAISNALEGGEYDAPAEEIS